MSPDLWPCSEVIRLRTLQRRVRERLLFPEVKGNSLVIFCYLICGGYLICCFFFIINLSACPPTHCSFYLTRQMDVDGLSLRYINCNHNSALTNKQMNASNKDLRTNNLKDRKQSDTRRPYIWISRDLPQLTDFSQQTTDAQVLLTSKKVSGEGRGCQKRPRAALTLCPRQLSEDQSTLPSTSSRTVSLHPSKNIS